MTETAIAIPTAAAAAPATAAPAQAVSSHGAPASEATETHDKGRFRNALLHQLNGLKTRGADTAPAGDAVTAEVLLAVAGDAKPSTDPVDQDGMALPLPGQLLPLDPNLLAATPPPTQKTENLPTGAELAAALLVTVNAASGRGAGGAPRLNLTPVANAVAQVTAAPGQTSQTAPELLAAVPPQTAQHVTITATQAAALAAEQSGQSQAAPVSVVQTSAVINPLASSTVATPASVAPAHAVPVISIPVAQPGWDQALGQRVQWLVGQQMQSAELRITPPHLGPIEVRISIGQDQQTVVSFASPHAAVRDAIESAMPRLRDMLGNNGQDLVNVNVSQHSFAEQRRQAAPSGGGREHAYPGDLPVDAAEAATGAAVAVRAGAGLVDYFA